jgi:hypothetical protein
MCSPLFVFRAPLTLALLGLALTASGQAQNVWSACAVTAVPYYDAAGNVRTQTFDLPLNSRGIRLLPGFNGTAYAYLPVTASNGAVFSKIVLVAQDPAGGLVRAEFFKQPRIGPGIPTLLGVVTTIAVGAVQTRISVPFAPEVINQANFAYYIRLTLKRDANQLITAYDVSLEP